MEAEGFKPPTVRLKAACSISLSYASRNAVEGLEPSITGSKPVAFTTWPHRSSRTVRDSNPRYGLA